MKRIALHAHLTASDPARFEQRFENGGHTRHILADLAQRRLAFVAAQDVQHTRLHRRFAAELLKLGGRRLFHEFEMAVHHEAARFVPHRLWEHRAQHLMPRDDVVLGDPPRQFDQSRREHRSLTDDRRDFL